MKEQNRNKKTIRAEASGTPLAREAVRLLERLAGEGACALPDPTREGDWVVRAGGSGISLGAGRATAAAARTLLSAGLAEPRDARTGALVIAAAGRAWLRRAAVAPAADAYRAQHLEVVAQGGEEGPKRDAAESPLAWMARRRDRDGAPFIDPACFEAGERLRRDLTLAAMMPRVTSDWSAPRVDGSGARDPAAANDAMLAAHQRVDHALRAVGNDLSGLLIDLCGFLKGLERIEVERGWPARSGKVVVRLALGRLAEHYGLERQATGPDRGRLRLWRAQAGQHP